MKSLLTWLSVAACAVVLAGCASQSTTPSSADNANAQSETSGASQGNGGQATNLGQVRPSKNVVHFAFDQSDIESGDTTLLTKTAAYLAAHSQQKVRLEGYTDERGTQAYNMALGDRRAQSVKHFLLLKGVDASQLSTVSYGEENPANPAHNETAWAQNRRVVIAYQ